MSSRCASRAAWRWIWALVMLRSTGLGRRRPAGRYRFCAHDGGCAICSASVVTTRRSAICRGRRRFSREPCGPAAVRNIFWMHDVATGRHWLEKWARRTRPDLVLCNSDYTAATLPRLYPQAPHELLRYPVALRLADGDPARRTALRRHFATPEDAILIVQVSRIQPWKGHLVHLAAIGPGARGAGMGVLDRRWRAAASGRAISRYQGARRRIGIANRARFAVSARMSLNCSARRISIVSRTRTRALGIVFIEAPAAGLPVVTAGLGGALEIVDSTCG